MARPLVGHVLDLVALRAGAARCTITLQGHVAAKYDENTNEQTGSLGRAGCYSAVGYAFGREDDGG